VGRAPNHSAAALTVVATRLGLERRAPQNSVSPRVVEAVLEVGLAVVVLAAFVSLKLAYNPPLSDGLDGAYYFHIARRIAAGEGFTTNLSIYHMGLEPLPQPAMTYPLLPLVVGGLGRFIGVEAAARWVPETLYWLSLVLCYVWLRAQARRSLKGPRWLAPALALVVTTWLGINPVYHWASSRTYTESLGLTLVFGSLLAYGSVKVTRSRSDAREALGFGAVGLLAGFAYLARFQLLLVSVSLVVAELVGRGPRRYRRALCLAFGAALPIGLWALRFLGMPNASLRPLFDFAAYRQLPSLPALVYTADCGSAWACAVEKLDGILEALHPNSRESYVAQFGTVVYLLPLSLIGLAVVLVRARGKARLYWARLRSARYASLVASSLIGVLSVLPIHLVHSLHWNTWAFGWRQGLPLFFVLAPLLLLLLAGFFARGARLVGRGFAVAAAVTLAFSCFSLGQKTLALRESDTSEEMLAARRAIADYLQRFALRERTLGIEPQPIAAFTDAPLDWLACWSVPELAERLVEERHVTRVVLRQPELDCPSLALIRSRFVLQSVVGSDIKFGVFSVKPR
jgi:hypothetical protein